MNPTSKCLFYLLPFAIFLSCREPYTPPVIKNAPHYLVVEGVITTGSDSTLIKLSRTVGLYDSSANRPESNAAVTVENEQNASYPLTEKTRGNYSASGLILDTTKKYRVRIVTSDNQEYLSELVTVQIAPPIDSIGFNQTSTGLQIYANTHDPKNNTRYYRWSFVETWQFHSNYNSGYVTDGSAIEGRTKDQDIYSCFGNASSTSIILGSSAKLSQDVIYQNPITIIESGSEKIETKYSIQLYQYALTADAYNFWVNLKKNTEQLGSIFDAQPSSINGNIHNVTNPSEPVIGYVSACYVQSKRIFISRAQLPSSWMAISPFDCGLDTILYTDKHLFNDVAAMLIPLSSTQIPVYALPGDPIPGYMASSIPCVDCTIRGTKKKPDFWK